jgi:ATP-dependent RNA helicase MSS116
VRFADLGLDERLVRALSERFGYAWLSKAQAQYLPQLLGAGADAIVRAPTGSGKTLGFLVPIVQRVGSASGSSGAATRSARPGSRPIRALVLSPTRELAQQTAAAAAQLLAFYERPRLGVQVVTGGGSAGGERARLAEQPCDVLVATTGRLVDHIESTPGFAARLRGVRVLVLDEADRMLDPSFLRDVRRVAQLLPPAAARQTLLLTATLGPEVREAAAALMKPAAAVLVIDVKGGAGGDAEAAAAAAVPHVVRVLPVEALAPAAFGAVARHAREAGGRHKVLVFAPTARLAELLAALMRASGHPALRDAIELHSRLAQNKREAATRRFREGSGVVCVASDVVGRGLDFPGVSLVVLLGVAADDAQVVHRVGRTGRGGHGGSALTLLGDDEAPPALLRAIKARLPLTRFEAAPALLPGRAAAARSLRFEPAAEPAAAAGADASGEAACAAAVALARSGRDAALAASACRAYSGTLGFYNGNLRRLGWSREQLAAAVARRFVALGAAGCSVDPKALAKMNLKGLPPHLFQLPPAATPHTRSRPSRT